MNTGISTAIKPARMHYRCPPAQAAGVSSWGWSWGFKDAAWAPA